MTRSSLGLLQLLPEPVAVVSRHVALVECDIFVHKTGGGHCIAKAATAVVDEHGEGAATNQCEDG
eukprot:6354209-Prymnesium_polylepis.1